MRLGRTRRIRPARRPDAASPWPFVGMAGIATIFFLYAASALVAPWWAVAALMAVWVVLLVRAVTWWTPHPGRLVWLAVGGAALWFVVLVAGARFLGWQA